MCELFGFTAREPMDLRGYLQEFYSHSVRHPHGWGIMREVHGQRLIEREGIRAVDSARLPGILDTLEPQRTLLAHIRFATVGSIRIENCHPFTARDLSGREWTLIHNGTIYSGRKLIKSVYRQTGDTDSERLFLYLLHCINERQGIGKPLDAGERFALLDDFVQEMSPRNKLNLLVWDGELLYVHKNLQDTLKYKPVGTGVLFATTPLDEEGWLDVPTAQLTAYSAGEQVFTGTQHSGIFVPALDHITPLDAMHI